MCHWTPECVYLCVTVFVILCLRPCVLYRGLYKHPTCSVTCVCVCVCVCILFADDMLQNEF